MAATFPWGKVQGRVAVPTEVAAAAAQLASEHYAEAEAAEFCGDPVDDVAFPAWMSERRAWLPPDLRALGFEVTPTDSLLATVGVDDHVDDIHGPVLAIVLFNDGLKFVQRSQRHVSAVGDWFVFDDRQPHGVREGKATTSYLVWTTALRWCRSC